MPSVRSARSASRLARAKAAGMPLEAWKRVSTRSGIVSVRPPILPETTVTAPNSPMARALQRMTP